jgi:hypothetical protein
MMRSSRNVFFNKYYNDQIKKREDRGREPTRERGEMHTTCWLESLNGTDHLKRLGVGRRILKWTV